MVLLQHKLNVKLSQRQILTPGLVQMVSVLALILVSRKQGKGRLWRVPLSRQIGETQICPPEPERTRRRKHDFYSQTGTALRGTVEGISEVQRLPEVDAAIQRHRVRRRY